jgi:hypothetical protein
MTGAARGPALSREAAASISQVIVTLTLLLANAGSTNGFMAYSCEDMRNPVVGYELTPAGGMLDEAANTRDSEAQGREGRVYAGRGPVSYRPLQDDGNSDASRLRFKRRNRTLEDDRDREVSPPRGCMEISDSGRATLFDRAVALTRNGTAMETSEERVQCDSRGRGPIRRGSGVPGKAHVQLTMRRIAV